MKRNGLFVTGFVLLAAFALTFVEAPSRPAIGSAKPAFTIDGRSFATWGDYYGSSYFAENRKRCGKPDTTAFQRAVPDPGDCTYSLTNPTSDYDTVDIYEIPVVVHIIEHSNGDGAISDALVNSQIDILNEDFRAIAGTPGAPGFDTGIQFVLATEDPMGNPTTGITRSTNDTWFNDGGSYWDSLAWDTANYMNVYTNSAGGNLGYVPDLPQGGLAGSNSDRVVVLWSSFGRNSPGGPPYDQGRTLTHEVGHYLGLEHTFTGGCATETSPGCYSSGDLICDTNSEQSSTFGCPGGASSCGSPDPIDNYMDYSDDTCMEMFTNEQSHRMRCSLLNYRSDLYSIVNPGVCGDNVRGGVEDCDGTDDDNCEGLCQIDCTCPAPVCGNGVIETGEECDGATLGSCVLGPCDGDCTCPDPVCGNNVIESGEECDGTDPGMCPTGTCDPGCTCPAPVCGNDVLETGEECDGTDDAACPGECLPASDPNECECPTSCGNGTCEAGEDETNCAADCGCAAPGTCGDEAPAGCFCDEACVGFGDCCPDVCDACDIGCVGGDCPSSPATGCFTTTSKGSYLQIRTSGTPDKDLLGWKWSRGELVSVSDLLDPVGNSSLNYNVCVYDSSGATQPLAGSTVPGASDCNGKPCWKAGSSAAQFKDSSATFGGVKQIKLKSGFSGRSLVLVKGKGTLLAPPTPPLTLPVTIQLIADDGTETRCWENVFDDAIKNEAGRFKAKAP